MTRSISLILLGACSTVASISCEGATEWSPQVYKVSNTKVYHTYKGETHLYINEWYAEPAHNPEAGMPWTDKGVCDQGTIGVGLEDSIEKVDCSDAFPYVPGSTYPNPGTFVHYNNMKYKNGYWAGATEVPGSHAAWDRLGQCQSGTTGAGPTGEIVDCTGINQWTKWLAYSSESKAKVHYEGRLYSVNGWTQGDVPGAGGPWTFIGTCASGTDSLGPVKNPNEVTPEVAAVMCSCCHGCAENRVGNVVCRDDAATEDECLYTWCPHYNTFDEERCAQVKKDQVLSWYTGEIKPNTVKWPERLYIPYIDAGLAKQPDIVQLAKEHGVKHFILAFITAEVNTTECRGAFASVIPFRTGPTAWNGDKQANDYLYDKLNDLRELGGDIVISAGGANGIELADSANCQDVVALKNAYKEIIEFLKLTHLDFDIEGNAYASTNRETGWQRRFEAVKLLVEEIPDLEIWWTLPILPTGLTQDGLWFIEDMMKSGVRMNRFNVMTMDYGDENICPGDKMHECEISAIENLAKNFYNVAASLNMLSKYGWTSPEDVYPMLGSTPMLGMNDLTHEVYTPSDARKSMQVWKNVHKLGLLSNWSVQRDAACDVSYVSTDCSSINVQSHDLEFLDIFSEFTSN